MAIVPPVLTCSTCDDYQLVPNDTDGMLERCPDCLHRTAVRCPVHGRTLKKGKCPECKYEAHVAEERIELFHGKPPLHPLAGAIQS